MEIIKNGDGEIFFLPERKFHRLRSGEIIATCSDQCQSIHRLVQCLNFLPQNTQTFKRKVCIQNGEG